MVSDDADRGNMSVTRDRRSFDARPPDCAFPTHLSDNRLQSLVTQHLEPIPRRRRLFSLSLHRFRFRLSPELGRRRPRCSYIAPT